MKKYKLGEIAYINKATLKASDKIDIIEYLDTSSITENSILETQILKRTDAPSRAQRRVSNNTIIYSTVRPNLKHYGLLKNPNKNFIVSTGFATLDLKETMQDEINSEYLFFLLTQDRITNYLHGIAQNSVSSYPSINPSDIEKLVFDFPPLSEQKRIAKVLSDIDAKIALNKKINQELEAMAKEIYDYWFIQFDYPAADGKPYKTSGGKMHWNEILKRPIPANWEVKKLGEIANITMGQSPLGSSYNENGDGKIFFQGCADFGERFPNERIYTTAPIRFAKKGDILMSVRAPVGTVNIANENCCIGRGLAALNSKLGSIMHLEFIIKDFKTIFEKKGGTTFGSITKEELYNLPVVEPNHKVLNQFEEICKPINLQLVVINSQLAHLTQLRNELLPLLMNGQVAV